MSVLIKNGTIVNADQSFQADVLCADGKIQEIGSNISAPSGAEIIDAAGQYVMPGGIDPHTCLLYTSPSPRDLSTSRMPSSA